MKAAMRLTLAPAGGVLSAALASMTVAGTSYWAPALSSSLGPALSLSTGSRLLFAATFHTGFMLSGFPGALQKRIGPRYIAVLGSCGLCVSYSAIALIVHLRPTSPMQMLLPLAVCISLSSYCISSSSAASVSVSYPVEARGRVTGLLYAIYAMSGGLLATFQTAVFPSASADPASATSMILAVAFICLLPAVLSRAFPLSLTRARTAQEGTYLRANECCHLEDGKPTTIEIYESIPRQGDHIGTENPFVEEAGSISPVQASSIAVGYAIAVAIAVVLYVCALVDWFGGVVFSNGLRIESVLMTLLFFLLLSLSLPALLEMLGRRETEPVDNLLYPETVESRDVLTNDTAVRGHDTSIQREGKSTRYLPVRELLVKDKFRFLVEMFATCAGCGGLSLMNTAETSIAARMLAGEPMGLSRPSETVSGVEIGRQVRAMVVLFSAANVAGRLFAGAIMDSPLQSFRQKSSLTPWRFRLLQTTAATLAAGMLVCIYASSDGLLLASGGVGLAHGMFFSLAPTLSQDFFGVESFPRDYALIGIGSGTGCIFVAWISSKLVLRALSSGEWVVVSESPSSNIMTRYCAGPSCYQGTYALSFLVILLALGRSVYMQRTLLTET